jgi:hypothetical protein
MKEKEELEKQIELLEGILLLNKEGVILLEQDELQVRIDTARTEGQLDALKWVLGLKEVMD